MTAFDFFVTDLKNISMNINMVVDAIEASDNTIIQGADLAKLEVLSSDLIQSMDQLNDLVNFN